MDVSVGDMVRYLNSKGGGTVTGFARDGRVMVLDDDFGMEIPVARGECVVVSDAPGMSSGMKMHYTGGVGVKMKEDAKPSLKQVRTESKPQPSGETLEIDLHIERLTQTKGLSDAACLNLQIDRCRRALSEHRRHKGLKIVLIHGKGDGTLRLQIMKLLMNEFPACTAADAPFSKYGMYGATEVTIG